MHGGLDISACQETQSVAGVDGETAVEGLSPLPFTSLVVSDLQRSNGLSEEESDGAEVGVAARPQAVVELLNLLGCELGVLHVPQVRLVMCLPFVKAGEEIFGELQSEGDEVVQGVQYLVVQVLTSRVSALDASRLCVGFVVPWQNARSPPYGPRAT